MGKSLKSLKSLMQIFATYATYASAIFVGKESNEGTVRYALWSRISLTKPLLNPYLTLTRFRLSLGSNLSRFSLASLICLCMLTIGSGNVWGADMEITYGNSTTGWTITDKGWSSSYWGLCNQDSYCIISPNISDLSQVTSVEVYARTYGGTGNNSQKIGVWTGSTRIGSQQSATDSYNTYTFTPSNLSGSGTIKVRSDGTNSSKGLRVTRVTIKFKPTYTLKLPKGDGTYSSTTTTNKADLIDDDIPFSGANCGGETLNGTFQYYWVTSAIPQASAVNSLPSTKYNSSNAPAYDVTLYPLFQDGTTSKYHTAPSCVASCANTVTVGTGASTNGSITLSSTSVTTCGDAASRQVTVSVAPNTCYAGPADASVITKTGTAASNTSYVSGPTWNGSTSKYDYVYQFTQNASGAVNFAVTLSTKTTYTVQYAQGDVPSGGGSISGLHVNDTKTCGDAMDLPAASFTTTGYTQTGWSKTNGGTQYAAVGGSYTDNAAQTFYPVWTANKYTVTWSVNGSTYTTTANVSYNTTTSTPANPSVPGECTGSTFMGWTATQNYTGDSAPGNMFNGTSPTITGDITFYAVFAEEN